MPRLQDLTQRVERLLLRYQELKRTNLLLEQKVNDLQQERHQLQLRLNAARSRVETLLSRLPVEEKNTQESSRQSIESHEKAPLPRILGDKE